MRFSVFLSLGLFTLCVGCAPLTPDLPSGDEHQLDRPASLSGTPPPGNPLDTPDEATLSHVPGQ